MSGMLEPPRPHMTHPHRSSMTWYSSEDRTRSQSVRSVSSTGSAGSVEGGQASPPRRNHGELQPEGQGRQQHHRAHDGNFVKELSSQLRWRNRNLLALTQVFLPAMISEALVESAMTGQDLQLPFIQHRSGAVARVHCSGFVDLITALQHQPNGASMLSRCIHRFYTLAIDTVVAYRGDVVRFNANTMIIFFEAVDDFAFFNHACGSLSCKHSPQELACIRVAACCYELHKQLHHLDVGEGGGNLTLRIGVGSSAMTVLPAASGQHSAAPI